MHRLALLSLASMLAGHVAAGPPEPRSWYDIDLRLDNALWLKGNSPVSREHQSADLLLHLGVRDGLWRKDVIGWAGEHRHEDGRITLQENQYNQMDHEAQVEATVRDDGTVELDVQLTANADPWIPGGNGRYTVRLRREGQVWTGSFEGMFRGRRVRGKATGKQMPYLWPRPVEGVRPAGANEHPRLLFRKSDLPALRARMQTPEGKRILARLKATLGGGQAMPDRYSRARRAYGHNERLPVGAYTLWHGMGFGFLYQLTGEKEYAELARKCVDKALAGTRDRDPRYSWVRPGGKLRAGSSYAAIAMAYDLCYDAWDPAYRQKLARAIQDKVFLPGQANTRNKALKEPVDVGLVFRTGGGQHSPWSNHYGAWNGGGGSAILAILGDEGTDDRITQRCHRVFLRRAKRALRVGYGHSAWFYEGHHGGRLSSNTGLITYLIHLRVSQGLDLVQNCPEAKWLAGKHMFEIVRQNGRLLCPERGIYANGRFERGGMSTGGDFARGFGIAPEDQRPALKWFFNHVIEPGQDKTYDAIRYPHHAVFAFLYWPIDEPEKNPAEAVGKVLLDSEAGYSVLRSGWSGTEEDVVAAIHGGSGMLLGMGLKERFQAAGGRPTRVQRLSRDTWIIRYADQALVADMNGPAGAALTLVTIRDLDRVRVGVKDPGRELTDEEKAFLKMLEDSQREKRRQRARQLPEDPPPPEANQAALVQRHRSLGDRRCVIQTVQRGPGPEIEIRQVDQTPRLRVGDLEIWIQDGKVRAEAVAASTQ